MGFSSANLPLLAEKIKQLLKLKTFFTAGEKEVRSWLVRSEAAAKECAGLIHSEFEKKLAQVEVYHYEDWQTRLQEDGKVRGESVRYVVKEGDICYFIIRKN